MDFSQRQADPRRHLIGLTAVIAFHVLVVYALVTGLAKKVVDVVRAPIETKVIEVIKKPPPPPEIIVPPPPKLEAPPPPFIPPPEIQITAPPPPQPTITATTPTPPPAPVVIAPTPPAVVEAPPAPPAPPAPKPAVVSIGVVCPTMVKPVMPVKAARDGIGGVVRARATIRGNKVVNVDIISSQPRGLFDAAVRAAMMQYTCQTTVDADVLAEQEFGFKAGE